MNFRIFEKWDLNIIYNYEIYSHKLQHHPRKYKKIIDQSHPCFNQYGLFATKKWDLLIL